MATWKSVKSLSITGKLTYSRKRRHVRIENQSVKENGNELKIEVEGAEQGICNLLQKKLLEDERVDLAGYDMPHPLASNPVIYVRTKDNVKPEKALITAAEKARDANEAFRKALDKAIKA